MWCDSAGSLAWAPVKEIGRSGEGLRLECGRRMHVNEHGTTTIVESTQCALRLAVLRRSIWAREAKHNAIVLEVFSEGKIIKLAAIVSLETENGQPELTIDIGAEGKKSRNHIRFVHQRKSPDVMGIVIDDHQVIFVS